MTTKTSPIFVSMSSIATCIFQQSLDRTQIRCMGDSDGNILAYPVSVSTPITPEYATATLPANSMLVEEENHHKIEEKLQGSPTTEKKTEGKKEEFSEDIIVTGTYQIAHLPLPSSRVVYLQIDQQRSNQYAKHKKNNPTTEGSQGYGSGLIYDYIVDDVYPPPEELNWDAYFVPYVFVSDGVAEFDPSFNSYKLKPYTNIYFDFEVNPITNPR